MEPCSIKGVDGAEDLPVQVSGCQLFCDAGTNPYSDRLFTSEETLRRIEPFLKTHGITRLARLTGLDRIGIPVWNAVIPNSKSIVINQGKGITDSDAKASAAMEALERSVAGNPNLEISTATLAEMRAGSIPVATLPELVARHQSDIEDSDVVNWARGFDLIGKQEIWVPADAIILDRTGENSRFWQSSDGLASGNNRDEALLHGLLERIERDALALWQVSSLQSRLDLCVDPASFGNPVLDNLIEKIIRAGLLLRIFDVTSDIGVPAFTAVLAQTEISAMKRPLFIDVAQGNGAHPNPVRAVIRAVTEAAQSRLTFISSARDDVFPQDFVRPLPQEIQDYFTARPNPYRSPMEVLPAGPWPLLQHTLMRLKQAGISSAIAVSLTAGSEPFSVVKMIVPQLENPEGPRKRRFGPRAISRSLLA